MAQPKHGSLCQFRSSHFRQSRKLSLMWKTIIAWVISASTFVMALSWAAAAAPGLVRVTSIHLVGAAVFIGAGVVLIVNRYHQKRGK
jgi:bacteriorhodopsin